MRRYARTLVAVALATTVVSGTAGWVSGNAQQAVTGPPPGITAWRADRVLGRELPDPERESPAEVGRFFRGLGEQDRQTLLVRHPLVVGNLDGVPVELRYRANARALKAGHDPRYASLAEDPHRQILAFDPRGAVRSRKSSGTWTTRGGCRSWCPVRTSTRAPSTVRPMCTGPRPGWPSPFTGRRVRAVP